MAVIKTKDAAKMNNKEITEKLKELNVELIRAKVNSKKGGKSNMREIKKAVARLLTFKKINKDKIKYAGIKMK